MHSSVKNTRFKIIKYAVLIEIFALAVLVGIHYTQPGIRVVSKLLGTKAYAQAESCEWVYMPACPPHLYLTLLSAACPNGKLVRGMRIQTGRNDDGDIDWWNNAIYCCPP